MTDGHCGLRDHESRAHSQIGGFIAPVEEQGERMQVGAGPPRRDPARRGGLRAGRVVKGTGDGVHAVFANAEAALAVAVEAQTFAWSRAMGPDRDAELVVTLLG